jgi:L-ascorbate 6-phosphate lactonase
MNESPADQTFVFDRNDPYDREAQIQYVVPQLMGSQQYMESIRAFDVAPDAVAIWYLGQNGFVLKGHKSPLIAIDPYLTNSCAEKFRHLPFRLDRQLPIFIEPEDLDVDVLLCTHSHEDHADPETIRRLDKSREMLFLGPFDAMRVFAACGLDEARCRLIHPGESVALGEHLTLQPAFALPTDDTDLNHVGLVLTYGNGITFYNTGDTTFAERLQPLLPREVDVCAICINGGYHNLSAMEAATIVQGIRPRVVIPCHYDMMVNNVGSPKMMKVALDVLGVEAEFVQLNYYEPWVYRRISAGE